MPRWLAVRAGLTLASSKRDGPFPSIGARRSDSRVLGAHYLNCRHRSPIERYRGSLQLELAFRRNALQLFSESA